MPFWKAFAMGFSALPATAAWRHQGLRDGFEVVYFSPLDDGWRVDGAHVPELDGCLDVDLESSAVTNTLPVHRLALADGATAEAPAAYVRALDLGVLPLAQTYRADGLSYDYRVPAFDFETRLSYDESGLVLDYPGIAVRAA